MRIGLLARADDGGLGAQTWLYARHLQPDKILICHTEHQTRGHAQPKRFEGLGELHSCRRAPRPADAAWLVKDVDAVLTAECFYGLEIPSQAAVAGVRSVIVANPEMSGPELASDWYAHTSWRLDALHRPAQVIPMGIDQELMPRRDLLNGVQTFFHITSPAMCDRNGTELVLSACDLMRRDAKLLIRGGDPHREMRGPVEVTWLGHYDGMFYEGWPWGIDAFIIPRRFGGLCLPMLEAAALGLPIISLDLEPQRQWLPSEALVPAVAISREQMRGGWFDVHACVPALLADKMDALVGDPLFGARIAERVRAYADACSWSNLLPHYARALSISPDSL